MAFAPFAPSGRSASRSRSPRAAVCMTSQGRRLRGDGRGRKRRYPTSSPRYDEAEGVSQQILLALPDLTSGVYLDKKALSQAYTQYHTAIESCLRAGAASTALQVLESMEKHLRNPVRRSTYAVTCAGLARLDRINELDALLQRLWTQGNTVQPDERMCTAAANAAFESGRADVAVDILERMQKNGVKAGPITYSVLLKGYGRLRQPSKLVRVLEVSRDEGVELDTVAWNSAVDAFVRCGQIENARTVVTEMQQLNVSPNHTTFNTLIKGAGSAGHIDLAFELVSEMRRADLVPNHVTKNTLIDACMRVGLWNRACQILEEMMDNVAERPQAVIGYTIVCMGMVQVGRVDEAMGLLKEMHARDLNPDVVTYNSLIKALVSGSHIEQATKLYSHTIKRFGGHRDTYATMISGLCRHKNVKYVRLAEELLHSELHEQDVFNAVLSGYASIGMMKDAERVLRRMEACGNDPNVVTYTTLVSGYGRRHDLTNSIRVFRELISRSINLDVTAFNAIISSLARCDQVVLADKIFREMKECRGQLSPDLFTYSVLTQAHMRKGNDEVCWTLIDDMMKNGLQPNQRMLESLLHVCLQAEVMSAERRKASVLRLLDEMRAIDINSEIIQRWERRAREENVVQ